MDYLESVATGAMDTARGMAGLETGAWASVTLRFDHAVLGLRFDEDGSCPVLPTSRARHEGGRAPQGT